LTGRSVAPLPGFSWIDRAALAYLAVPSFLFLLGWFRWWAALPLAALLLAGCRHVLWPPKDGVRVAGLGWGAGLFIVLVAAGWSVLGGAGHIFYANFDWITRDSVLRDLVVGAWPVGYGEANGAPLALRAPLGYYLPAALCGKLFGLRWADPALLAWTATGVALFLGVAVAHKRTWPAVLVTVVVLVFFSGMDLVGTVIMGGVRLATKLRITDHLEWWAMRFQYSSHTTQLFWVPNHALAGWIATALLIRHVDRPEFAATLPVVAALIVPWSPLTAIGFLPLAAWWWLSRVWTERSLRFVDPVAMAAAVAFAGVIGAYLVMGADQIPGGATAGSSESFASYVLRCVQFVLLEAGLLWLMLLSVRTDGLVVVAGLVLWILPFVAFGPSNDLAMRASIPALAVLAIASADVLSEPAAALKRRVFWPIVLLLVLGAPTAVTEMARAVLQPAWAPNQTHSLVPEPSQGYPPHYVTRLAGSPVARMLRPVQNVNLESRPSPNGPESDRDR